MPNTKQFRARVAGGQDHEVKYEAGKTGTSKSEGKEAAKSAGNQGRRKQAGFEMSPDGLPTGEGTADKNDVADPHPSTEEDYDKKPRPGGAKPPRGPDVGANSYAHDGQAPRRPKNEGSKPE